MIAKRRIILVALALAIVSLLANWYSITHHLAYALGGHGQSGREGQQWMSDGTALGPPLAPLVLLSLAVPFAGSRRWWGALADVPCLLVALAMLFGTLGEPSTHTVFMPGSFNAVQAAFRLAMVAAVGTLGWLTGHDLLSRSRRRRTAGLASPA